MKALRRTLLLLPALIALGLGVIVPASAQAAFGFQPGAAGFNATAYENAPTEATLAGSHPDSLVTEMNFNQAGGYSEGDLKDLTFDLPPGLIENSTAVPRCAAGQFAIPRVSPFEASASGESCSDATQIGIVTLSSGGGKQRTF